MDDITEEAKANGTYEEGVLDVGNAHDKIVKDSEETFSTSEGCTLKLIKINHFKGNDWDAAQKIFQNYSADFFTDNDEKIPYLVYTKNEKVSILRKKYYFITMEILNLFI